MFRGSGKSGLVVVPQTSLVHSSYLRERTSETSLLRKEGEEGPITVVFGSRFGPASRDGYPLLRKGEHFFQIRYTPRHYSTKKGRFCPSMVTFRSPFGRKGGGGSSLFLMRGKGHSCLRSLLRPRGRIDRRDSTVSGKRTPPKSPSVDLSS